MANPDALKQPAPSRTFSPTLTSHLAYTLLSGLTIMLMLSLVRLGLLIYNSDMIGETPYSTVAEGFLNGLRFDLRVVVYISIPLLLAILSPWAMARRGVRCRPLKRRSAVAVSAARSRLKSLDRPVSASVSPRSSIQA